MLRLEFIGRIGQDAEVKNVGTNNSVINFSVAYTERFKDRNGNNKENTTWIKCAIWRKPDNVKIAEYIKKGGLVYISGIPKVDSYEGNNGKVFTSLSVIVKDLEFLAKPNNNTNNSTDNNSGNNEQTGGDDLPF